VIWDRDHAFDGWADTATPMAIGEILTAPTFRLARVVAKMRM
jgi:hypothetical protein